MRTEWRQTGDGLQANWGRIAGKLGKDCGQIGLRKKGGEKMRTEWRQTGDGLRANWGRIAGKLGKDWGRTGEGLGKAWGHTHLTLQKTHRFLHGLFTSTVEMFCKWKGEMETEIQLFFSLQFRN